MNATKSTTQRSAARHTLWVRIEQLPLSKRGPAMSLYSHIRRVRLDADALGAQAERAKSEYEHALTMLEGLRAELRKLLGK